MRTLVHDALLTDVAGERPHGWVLLDDAVIAEVGESGRPQPRADLRVDLEGARLTPGFIDIHVHGGGGHAAEDGADGMRALLEAHRTHGTTRSIISLVTGALPSMRHTLGEVAALADDDPLVLGAHLEGPFLSPARRGAHDPELLRAPTPREIEELIETGGGHLAQLTLAPELPGAGIAIDMLVSGGVRVAIGHTDADHTTAAEAFERGASLLTHAFNGMREIGHRAPGPVVAALDAPHVTLELILDGHHVDPRVAHLAFAAAGDRIALITDAMAAAASEDGDYLLGALKVEVRDGVARLSTTGGLAGSTLTLDTALRLAIERVGLDWPTAVGALTAVPARALGHGHRLGMLAPGYAADLVALGPGVTVDAVWADGARIR